MSKSFFYGGQAVIEGVMMRGRDALSIAVRRPDQSVVVQEQPLKPWSLRFPFLKWPLVRGAVALVEAMIIGMRALNFSANQQVEEDEQESLGFMEMAITFLIAMALTVGLFVLLPAYIIRLIQDSVASNVVLNLIEGVIKITFFSLYIIAIGQMSDIKRVFQYHGAEHMAINCHEAGHPLTVENVRDHSLIHTRCGTNFLLIVLFMSVFLFSFFGRPPFLQRVGLHLLLLPVVAGLSYEVIRHAARDNALAVIRWLATPGMWMQRLTTRCPEDDQIEIAIEALERVLVRDGALPTERRDAAEEAAAAGETSVYVR